MFNVFYELQNGTLLLYERNGATGYPRPLRHLGSLLCPLSPQSLVGKGPEDREYQILDEAIRSILDHLHRPLPASPQREYVAYLLGEDRQVFPLMGKYKLG